MTSKLNCPICNSKNLMQFLKRKHVPVHQNLPYDDKNSALNINRGNLTLTVCNGCGFIFNQDFENEKLSYGKGYENAQTFSPHFKKHVSNLIHHLIFEKNIKNSRIIEIGCGNGEFLEELVKNPEWGNSGIGFDPAYDGEKTKFDGRLEFQNDFFQSSKINKKIDVIICRHVIEHIEYPIQLLNEISKILENTDCQIFFETPNVEWILKNNVLWDFSYEHCSYFSNNSIKTAFESTGFKVNSIEEIFGNQYLWLEGQTTNNTVNQSLNSKNLAALCKEFSLNEKQITENWISKINKLKNIGNVALWGAAGKGVTLANLIDPNGKIIDYIIDLNPNKWGKFIPGSGHQIINFTDIEKFNIKSAVVMNPNYSNEIKEIISSNNLDVKLF